VDLARNDVTAKQWLRYGPFQTLRATEIFLESSAQINSPFNQYISKLMVTARHFRKLSCLEQGSISSILMFQDHDDSKNYPQSCRTSI